MKYIQSPPIVDAFEITWVGRKHTSGNIGIEIILDDGRTTRAPLSVPSADDPKAGDYWVQQCGAGFVVHREEFLRRYKPYLPADAMSEAEVARFLRAGKEKSA